MDNNSKRLKLSGFADEASSQLDIQIAITRRLGWKFLSVRTVGEKNVHDIPESDFEHCCVQLNQSAIAVIEFGSLIGNWSKSIRSDWAITLAEIRRCIPRMHRLQVPFVRIMSYAQEPWGQDQFEAERFRRVKEIHRLFAAEGLTALHENCLNWGGFSAGHTLRLLNEVPDLKLVFDTGNPVFQRDRSKPEPFPWQNALEFYRAVQGSVAHIHVKDPAYPVEGDQPQYKFPGEGDANLGGIIAAAVEFGYDGFWVIEPHMGKVFHEGHADIQPEKQRAVYLEFGHRFEQFLSERI